jgi:hypothetical protein
MRVLLQRAASWSWLGHVVNRMPSTVWAGCMSVSRVKAGTLFLVSLFAWTAASARDQVMVTQAGGSDLPSPDQGWIVAARTPKRQGGDARLLLSRTGRAKRQLLCEYFRSGLVAWAPDSRALVFIDYYSVDDSRLVVFRLDEDQAKPVRGADQALRRAVLARVPRGREVVFYTIQFDEFLTPSRLALTVNVVFLKGRESTGPATSVAGRHVLDLKRLIVERR